MVLTEDAQDAPRRAIPRKPLILLLVVLVPAVGLVGVWNARMPIARNYIDGMLADRGVAASYTIARLDLRKQRLEHVVLGNPAAPDLTAEWAEVGFGVSGLSPSIRSIRAGGVRVRGRLVDGQLSLGSLDRLLPKPSGKPFSLPDIHVDVNDARMRLATPSGPVGFSLAGSGNLADGFAGQMAAVAPRLRVGGCTIEGAAAVAHIAIAQRRPAIDGPVRAAKVACGTSIVNEPRLAIDLALNAALDRWNGGAAVSAAGLSSGAYGADGVRGRLSFKGNARETDARIKLFVPWIRPGTALAVLDSLDGTPVAPLGMKLQGAANVAMRDVAIEGAVNLRSGKGEHWLRVAPLILSSASGARLEITANGDRGVGVRLSDGQPLLDGKFTLSGGGFPTVLARLRRGDDGLAGTVWMEPYTALGARLAIDPLTFDRSSFVTRVRLDGPLGDGRIEGLDIPLDGRLGARGGVLINPSCVTLGFARLEMAGTRIGRTALPLCPLGPALFVRDVHGRMAGGAVIATPRLRGDIGGTPLELAAQRLTASIGQPGFGLDGLAVRLGVGSDPTRLDVERLAGGVSSAGLAGTFAGASGKIGVVPLLISKAGGRWSLRNAVLKLDGALALDDAAPDPRFHQLLSDDVTLTLNSGRIIANGTLHLPGSTDVITRVAISHQLGNGAGRAILAVPGIHFTPNLQPEMLTRLTLGIIANARGSVTGEGRIVWDRNGVRSDGDFATESMDFAAAFGPVEKLAGKIHFSDLLALATPPGQTVTLGSVNTGIAVNDGTIRYQLLPNQIVAIESGRWPFSGGALTLDQARLDFGQPSDRHLTFRVEGMDAAQFVEQFEFRNLAVTGVFDGVLPMIFGITGGRIEGGRLVVREAGGKLAYVGELSNEKLGRFGNLAFDALKSMRYQNLAIELDGALDGEIVSRVIFSGTNEAPVEVRKGLAGGLTGLPFKFNITIKAPFRSLVNSAQSVNDPRGLVSDTLARRREAESEKAVSVIVQPPESETLP